MQVTSPALLGDCGLCGMPKCSALHKHVFGCILAFFPVITPSTSNHPTHTSAFTPRLKSYKALNGRMMIYKSIFIYIRENSNIKELRFRSQFMSLHSHIRLQSQFKPPIVRISFAYISLDAFQID
jgi:hypothetical protein